MGRIAPPSPPAYEGKYMHSPPSSAENYVIETQSRLTQCGYCGNTGEIGTKCMSCGAPLSLPRKEKRSLFKSRARGTNSSGARFLLLGVLFLWSLLQAGENAPPEILSHDEVRGVYSINADVETTDFWKGSETWFGFAHAFAIKEAPGYVLTCSHAVVGRTEGAVKESDFSGVLKEGEALNLRSKQWHLRLIPMEIDLEPGKGKHLKAKPVVADIYADLALLKITKGTPEFEFDLAKTITPYMGEDCQIITGERGADPIKRSAGRMRAYEKYEKWEVGKSPRHVQYIFDYERSRRGNSGSPVLQRGELVSIVQRLVPGHTVQGAGPLGIRRFLRRAFEELGETELLKKVEMYEFVSQAPTVEPEEEKEEE